MLASTCPLETPPQHSAVAPSLPGLPSVPRQAKRAFRFHIPLVPLPAAPGATAAATVDPGTRHDIGGCLENSAFMEPPSGMILGSFQVRL